MKSTGTRYHWTVEQKAEMVRLYVEDEFSFEDIARVMGCTRETVRYHLLRRGVVLRGRGMQTARARAKYSGPLHHGWRGGRYIDHGYVRVLAHDHPHADDSGYVLEHRLLVERHLLRTDPAHPALDNGHLRRSWLVHHKNEVKTDNRIENLVPMSKAAHSAEHAQFARWHEQVQRMRAALEQHGIDW